MSAERRQLDPEIAALLREVPGPEGLRFLTDPRLDLRRAKSFRSAGPFRATRVEQHLLGAYREQVARLLRKASVRALREDPASTLGRYVGVDERIDVPSKRGLHAEVRYYRGGLGGHRGTEEDSALEALSGLVSQGPSGARQLAAASLRLVQRDDTRICLAVALIHEQQPGAAEGMLLEVIAGRPQALDASIAWNNIGTIHVAKGQLSQARDAFRRSAELAPYPASAISWLLQACKLGDEADALRAASHLGEILPAGHPALDEHARRRLSLPREYPDAFWATAKRIRDRAGPTARRIMDA